MAWDNEKPTARVANPLALAPPCPKLRRYQSPITREYEVRLVEATCLDASVRCARVALKSGR
jgi:hypothetical protein